MAIHISSATASMEELCLSKMCLAKHVIPEVALS